jgi:hypothetical protein
MGLLWVTVDSGRDFGADGSRLVSVDALMASGIKKPSMMRRRYSYSSCPAYGPSHVLHNITRCGCSGIRLAAIILSN